VARAKAKAHNAHERFKNTEFIDPLAFDEVEEEE